MAKKIFLCVVLVFSTAAVAGAVPAGPDWRGAEGSTFQEWTFSTPDVKAAPILPDPGFDNKYGSPELVVDTLYDWDKGGFWALGELDITIPNRQVLLPMKEIQIQLTWKAAGNKPFVPDLPNIGVRPDPYLNVLVTIFMDDEYQDAQGWNHSTYVINIYPNPFSEWISIKGDILVDEVIIDTICIPEPATLLLLGAGGLGLFTRRKRN